MVDEQQDVATIRRHHRPHVEMAGLDRLQRGLRRSIDHHPEQGPAGPDIRRVHAHVEEAAVVRQPGEAPEPLARQPVRHDFARLDLDELDDRLLTPAGGIGDDRHAAAVRQRVSRHLQWLVDAHRVQIDNAPPRSGRRVRKFDHREVLVVGDKAADVAVASEHGEDDILRRRPSTAACEETRSYLGRPVRWARAIRPARSARR